MRRASHVELRGPKGDRHQDGGTTNIACAIQNDKKIRRKRLFIVGRNLGENDSIVAAQA